MICVTGGTVKEIALKFVFSLEILQEGEEVLAGFFSSLGFRTVLTGHMFERVTFLIPHLYSRKSKITFPVYIVINVICVACGQRLFRTCIDRAAKHCPFLAEG